MTAINWDRLLAGHEIVYWALGVLCLIPAGGCLAGAVMNSHFAMTAENPAIYETTARYWWLGAVGFLVLGVGFAVNAAMIRRRRKNTRSP